MHSLLPEAYFKQRAHELKPEFNFHAITMQSAKPFLRPCSKWSTQSEWTVGWYFPDQEALMTIARMMEIEV